MKRESGMIRLLTAGVWTGLVAVVMAVTVPMIPFAQTTEPAIESTPAAAKAAVANSSPTSDGKGTYNGTSVQTGPPARPTIPASVEVEFQRLLNELRREVLDDRADTVYWWLEATAIFLTLLGIVAVIAGYLSFKRFREIEAEARQHVTASKQHAGEAQSLVEEIKAKRHEAESLVEKLNAETVGKDLDEAGRAAESVRGNPAASLIDQAIAVAVLLQKQGEIENAIEKWRAVAQVAEESDNNLAARAWFSVGYLLQNGGSENSISAYDDAIRLKPDYALAYNNRGNAKAALERHVEAIADFDEAIRLKLGFALAYYNRGNPKAALGQHVEAIADFDEAIRLKPGFAEAYYNRGNPKAALGQHVEAIADFDEAIRLKPGFAEAYNNRGTSKGVLGRHVEAIADFDEAICLKPDNALAYNNRGKAKAVLGRHVEAIADYDEAIRLKPDLADAYNNRGTTKAALGRKDEALKDFETALELARNTNNANIVDQAEQSLRSLDSPEGL